MGATIGCSSTVRTCSTRCDRRGFGDYLPEEGAKLGQPASHGCVRLAVADAQWFYDQVPDGTLVTIA